MEMIATGKKMMIAMMLSIYSHSGNETEVNLHYVKSLQHVTDLCFHSVDTPERLNSATAMMSFYTQKELRLAPVGNLKKIFQVNKTYWTMSLY